ncbi:MAG: hypothetical protein Ct9H300mP4_07610 [Gammaproteobacteria bacterium]|mgnify:FL=1|nr:MAG: hypothetical protein Ct9H300mP4_07610 [Gammaproteobacteria bacterium]|tara:strand:+ start:1347 stop:1862 length:516 start_codon:yes stop_codon:yes gene_type:complete
MSANEPTVFLDMDGVLVDFFNAFAKLANVKHWKQMDPQRLQDVLNKIVGSDYFAKLPKTNTCDSIVEMVVDFAGSYSILSSPLRGDIANSTKHKRAWVMDNLSPQPTTTIIVRDKSQYALINGVQNILIDDRANNIHKWKEAGGYGIKYQANENDLSVISGALKAYKIENT